MDFTPTIEMVSSGNGALGVGRAPEPGIAASRSPERPDGPGVGAETAVARRRTGRWVVPGRTRDGADQSLTGRLEASFGCDLSWVRFHPVRRLRDLGVLAFAVGGRVFVDWACWTGSLRELLPLLAHEVTHLLQQREGRIRATHRGLGLPVCVDPELEQEAHDVASRVARGMVVGRLGTGRTPTIREPAVQFFLSIQGEPVQFRVLDRRLDPWKQGNVQSNLPRRVLSVLPRVEGAAEWLENACRSTRLVQFPGYQQLVEGLLQGLSGTPVLHLSNAGVPLSPRCLFRLSDGDFFRLAEATRMVPESELGPIGLHGVSALSEAVRHFEALGVGRSGKPAIDWGYRTLGETILVRELYDHLRSEGVSATSQERAFPFAAEASDWRGFVERFWFYVQFLPTDPKHEAEIRGDLDGMVRGAWRTMTGLAVRFLDSPRFAEQLTPERALELVRLWIGRGEAVGFQSVGSAACNFVRYGGCKRLLLAAEQVARPTARKGREAVFGSPSEAELEQVVLGYFAAATQLLGHSPGRFVRTSQDGSEMLLSVRASGQEALLAVHEEGVVTLEAFNRGGTAREG